MKKTSIKKVNDSQTEMGSPVINIRIFIYDDYHTYKRHELVAQLDLLIKILETKSSRKYETKDFERLMYLAFRPNADINDYCMVVLKYICSYTNIADCLKQHPQPDLFCVLHINMDDFKWSNSHVFDLNEINNDKSFKLVGKLKTGVSMTLPSKFDFLSEELYSCLIKLVELVRPTGQGFLKLTYTQLWDIWEQFLDKDNDYDKYWIDSFLERLSFCDFIDFEVQVESKDGKNEFYYVISICDLEIYDKFLEMNR